MLCLTLPLVAPGPRFTPRSAAEWGAVLPVWLSGAALIFCLVFWAVTGRIEPALLTTFGGTFAAGQGLQALAALRSAKTTAAVEPPPVELPAEEPTP